MRGRRWFAATIAVLVGCGRPGVVVPSPRVALRAPADGVVPAGTLVSAQLRQPLSTRTSHAGDRFTAELLDPLIDGAGRVIVPKGAVVEGIVGGTDPSKVAGDGASISLELTGIRLDGERLVPLPLEVATAPVEVDSSWGQIVGVGLAGTAVGAGVGVAINSDQAAMPIALSLVGTGLGAIVGAAFGRRDASVESGSILTLRLREDVNATGGLAHAVVGDAEKR